MTGNEDENKTAVSDMEKLVADPKTISINGNEITVKPIKNKKIMREAVESEKNGESDADFLYGLVAETLNMNQGFDVTVEEVKDARGTILPLMQAVQEVNGLADFLDQSADEIAQSR